MRRESVGKQLWKGLNLRIGNQEAKKKAHEIFNTGTS